MNNAEFLAWFAGFSEHIKRAPKREQWEKILAQVARVEGGAPFKAWFEGFTAKMKGPPSADDWRKIAAKATEEQAALHAVKARPPIFRLFEDKAKLFSGTPKLYELYQRGRQEGRD